VRLDDAHYFDPQNRQVLLKEGGTYKNLGHDLSYTLQAAAKIEETALSQGYKPIAGGFFWNPGLKHLYVKNGGHYVLYSPDRRGPDRHPEKQAGSSWQGDARSRNKGPCSGILSGCFLRHLVEETPPSGA
jgi:hypothetical protein